MRLRSCVAWTRTWVGLIACDVGGDATMAGAEGNKRNPDKLLPGCVVVNKMPWDDILGAIIGNCWRCLAGVVCGTWKRMVGDDDVNTRSHLVTFSLVNIIEGNESLVIPWCDGDLAPSWPFVIDWLFFLPILYFTLLNTFKWMSLSWTSSHFGWMTSLDAFKADVHVPSLLTRMITLTRCVGMSVIDDLKTSLELTLKSSGGGVYDDDVADFSIKLNDSRAYIRFLGGKSDSSSVSDGFGVTKPFGNSISFNLRFNVYDSSDFCKNKKGKKELKKWSLKWVWK